jgi:hypothetical protein
MTDRTRTVRGTWSRSTAHRQTYQLAISIIGVSRRTAAFSSSCGATSKTRMVPSTKPAPKPYQHLADEIAGESDRIERQLRAREQPMTILWAERFQGIRSTHCARDGPGSNGSPKYWVSRATFPSRNSIMLTV